MVIFGIVGYILNKFEYEVAPLVLAFILGPIMETAFRRSLIMSDGAFSIFWTRPISAASLIIAALLFASTGLSLYRKTKPMITE